MVSKSFILMGLLLLFPNLGFASTQSLDAEQILPYVMGAWRNQQNVKCLSGAEPEVKPDVVLTIGANSFENNGNIRINVNKKVKPFSCYIPSLVEDEIFLSVDYTFDLLPSEVYFNPTDEEISSSSTEALHERAVLQGLLVYHGINLSDLEYMLKGVSTEPNAYEIYRYTMLKCDPLAPLSSPISLPEYFTTELSRSYVVDLNENTLRLYFVEDILCPNDVAMMSFEKQ